MTTESMMMVEEEVEMIDPVTLSPEDIVDAARWGEIELVMAMIDQGLTDRITSAQDERGNGMLHMAAANGHLDLCEVLLKVDVSLVNQKNREGNTPLHWAAMTGQVNIIRLLAASGADLLARNRMGRDALFEAEMALKEDAAALLNQLIEGEGQMQETAEETVPVEMEIDQ